MDKESTYNAGDAGDEASLGWEDHLEEVMATHFIFFIFLLLMLFYLFFPFIFISWRLITLQYCSGFCHTLT